MRNDTHILGNKERLTGSNRDKKKWHSHSDKEREKGQKAVNRTNKEATHWIKTERERSAGRKQNKQEGLTLTSWKAETPRKKLAAANAMNKRQQVRTEQDKRGNDTHKLARRDIVKERSAGK